MFSDSGRDFVVHVCGEKESLGDLTEDELLHLLQCVSVERLDPRGQVVQLGNHLNLESCCFRNRKVILIKIIYV